MDENGPIVYTPESVLRHPKRFFGSITRDLSRSIWVGQRLAVRDLRAQYRQAALGILWALLIPLANVAAWLLLRGAGVVDPGETGIPYWLYAVIGTLCWGIFVDALNAPLAQATAARPILARVSFPPEALVVSGLIQASVSALIKVGLIFAAVLAADSGISFTAGLSVLGGAASLILAGTAVGVLVTPLGLLYTDVAKALPLLSQFLMYLAPVVYVIPAAGLMASLIQMNPLTPLIVATRQWAAGIESTMTGALLVVDAAAVALLALVWVLYKAAMPIVVERMST